MLRPIREAQTENECRGSGESHAPCYLLPWDTEFFGFRIARVAGTGLSRSHWPAVSGWCDTGKIRCLYLLAPSDPVQTNFLIAECGFRFVDIRLTLDRDCYRTDLAPPVRLATAADVPALAVIARVSHADSRFYADGEFPREKCDELFQTWLEKSCSGDAKAVLTAIKDGRPAGYITCDWSGDTGQIGLVAVAEWARGGGLGRALVESSIGIFHRHGVQRVSVVTQGRNVTAQRLYQSCGFATRSIEFWFHRWFDATVE